MKKLKLLFLFVVVIIPKLLWSQCTTTNATSCQCPAGGGTDCDLLPDISIARLPLTQTSNYTEYPQVCNPPCSGNDGRLRLGVSTPIIGFGPLETRGTSKYVCGTDTVDAGSVANIPATCPITGDPPHQLINQRIYHKNGNTMTFTDRAAGSMTYHPTHGHQHVDDWGIYTLRQSNGDPNPLNWPIIGNGAKLGFCLLDIGSCNGSSGYCTDSLGNTLNSTNIVNYGLGGGSYSCSNTVQGISNGYMDTYSQSLDGMWINIQPQLCNGTYYVVVQIDPHNYFTETNENNNVLAVPITLTQQAGNIPVISTSGPTILCPGQSVTLTSTAAYNYVWSNGATTQSITVNAAGTFTVTVNTALPCSTTSQPVSVTIKTITATASATPSTICAGQTTQLSVTHNASGTTTVPTAFTNTTQVFIPDNNSTGVTSPIAVSGISPTTLSSGMIVSVKLNLTHTYNGDLLVSLIAPSGNTINLSNRRGGSGDNFTNTVFSMSATTNIANGTAPFTGLYIPDGSFNSLTGTVNGTWTLKIADLAAVDTGRIRDWTITINNQIATAPNFSWTSTPAGFTSATQNPPASPTGNTTYNVVITDGSGCTGSSSVSVTVNPLPNVTADNVSGCVGSFIPLSGIPASGGIWSVANPYTGSSTTYTHTYTDGNGCTKTSNSANITVNPLPTVSFSGLASSYNVNDAAVTLTGSPPNGIFSGAGISGNTFTPSVAGVGGPYTITYSYTDGNTCNNSSSQQTTITNCVPPAQPGNITVTGGITKVCPGNNRTYTISAVPGATSYTWTPPIGGTITSGQGTVSITVNFTPSFTASDTVRVIATNSCGSSPQQKLAVTRNTPATPSTITGDNFGVCNGIDIPYSVTSVAGMTYNWSFSVTTASISAGQGSNAVTANFGATYVTGSLSVNASNTCGTSANRTLTVKATPATPTAITGPTAVCKNQQGVPYSTTAIASATSYTWVAPTNCRISDGITTSTSATFTTTSTSVTVNYKKTAGTLKVRANNACGSGAYYSITITFVCRDANEIADLPDFTLHPNPAKEDVEINYISDVPGSGQLTISDIMGRILYAQPLNVNEGETISKIDLKGISRGIYFVTIIQSGNKLSKKLVID